MVSKEHLRLRRNFLKIELQARFGKLRPTCLAVKTRHDCEIAEIKKGLAMMLTLFNTGRSTRIRTLDPLVPNQVRYRAALHSEKER